MMDIAFVSDENYLLPTSIAIASLIKNNNHNMKIHILTTGMSLEGRNHLKSMSSANANVVVYDVENEFLNMSTQGLFENIPANHSSLLKFNLPTILKDVDKLLFLDGDLIVNKDISELYNVELGDSLVAAVCDHVDVWHKKQLKVKKYFNSGVMLLNLKKMRNENYVKKLTDYRCNGFNKFMDQDAFNAVFAGKVIFLPFRFNTLYSIMEYFSPEKIRQTYRNKKVLSYDELIEEAVVIHFSSNQKPWKVVIPGVGLMYKQYLELTPFRGTEFDYKSKSKDVFASKQYLKYYLEKEKTLVSIVVLAQNIESTINATMESLINQTLKNIEIVVVDNASTDATAIILNEYANKDPRIKIVSIKQNVGICEARKKGGLLAEGKFIMFVEGDGKLELNACEELYSDMILNDVDMIQFQTKIVDYNSDHEMVNEFDKHINNSHGFLTRDEVLEKSFISKTLSGKVWNRIYKREVIQESFKLINDECYLNWEDVYTSLLIAYSAKNLLFVNKKLCIYSIGSEIKPSNKSVSCEKFERICTCVDVVACIAKFIANRYNDEKNIFLLANFFKHCFQEINSWIQRVKQSEFNKCLNLVFGKYENILPLMKSEMIAAAIAQAFDEMLLSIQEKKEAMVVKISDLFSKVKYNHEVCEKFSVQFGNFIMNQKKSINIVTIVDDDNACYLIPLINSICKNAKTDRCYNVLIFCNNISDLHAKKFAEFNRANIKINLITNFEVEQKTRIVENYSLDYLSHIISYVSLLDKVVYLSYDSIVNCDLTELFDMDIDMPIAAVQQYDLEGNVKNENFLVDTMLINTKKFNEIIVQQDCLNLNKNVFEQEFFNTLFKSQISFLDDKWCFQWHIPYQYLQGCIETNFKIINFGSNDKPWKNPSHAYADEFWKYARETSVYEEILFKNIKSDSLAVSKTKNFNVVVKRSLLERFKNSVRSIGFWATIKKVIKLSFGKFFKKGGRR